MDKTDIMDSLLDSLIAEASRIRETGYDSEDYASPVARIYGIAVALSIIESQNADDDT